MPTTSLQRRHQFATTNWNLVRQLTGPDGEAALAALCEQYWFPLYAFVRRKLASDHDARDATQEFFAWLLEKNLLRRAAADRGRLRSFLLTALQNFLRNKHHASRRQKRGGGLPHLPLDFAEGSTQFAALPADQMTPERLYERSWALLLLQRVMSRLEQEMEAAGQKKRFQILQPALTGEQTPGFPVMAANLGISEAAARQAASRLRKRYRQLLQGEVQATLADPADTADEIDRLFQALAPA